MPRQRNNPSSTVNNQGNEIAQKENEKSSENNLKHMEDYDLNVRIQDCSSEKNSRRYKKTKKGRSSMTSGIKSTNKKGVL